MQDHPFLDACMPRSQLFELCSGIIVVLFTVPKKDINKPSREKNLHEFDSLIPLVLTVHEILKVGTASVWLCIFKSKILSALSQITLFKHSLSIVWHSPVISYWIVKVQYYQMYASHEYGMIFWCHSWYAKFKKDDFMSS